MKISIYEALELARKSRENGPCSAQGQALVHLLNLFEKLERRRENKHIDIDRRQVVS